MYSMGDGHGGKKIASSKEMENLSLSISTSRFPRDLLQRFLGTNSSGHVAVKKEEKEEEEDDDDDEIELNLGLSLGGRFGVDKSSRNLIRSSSIASCSPVVRDDNDVAVPPTQAVFSGLIRTSSMPVGNEEEWRKRKELQSLRRMEAKKRRSKKQRKERGESGNSGSGGGSLTLEDTKVIEVNLRRRLDKEMCFQFGSSMESQFGLSGASNEVINRSVADVARGKGKGACVGSSGRPGSQGSVESRGVSSSSVLELDSKTLQVSGSTGELSPNSIQSLQEGSNKEIGSSGTTRPKESTSRTDTGTGTSRNQGRETGTTSLGDMPCVFTKGDGLNGRRVDGILYKYGRGDEVRIMCVCHGSFYSPAEFVKHAGGSDVDNPLKHIVINPSSSSLL